jgi:DNA-directed RNA polymerase specialized sigma24 family protein
MRSRKISERTADHLKDEVYRQMLRLEGRRPAAHVLLATALLHAWVALERQPAECEPRQWLRRVSPVCLRMIEKACQAAPAGWGRRGPEDGGKPDPDL